ncbi:uncharacterized protein [Diabrotica undecimpunctata]|uniref:uncharacterized protein n=1 Tax=Diabrotica undecimpunctata TaxID=50387 RepID=UPI003B636AC9
MLNPSITATELKNKHPGLLQSISTRTICHRFQKDLTLPSRRAAKKTLFTKATKKKRLDFSKRYQHWTPEQWKKVMFSDESTFRLIKGSSKFVRRPNTASRYDSKFTVKTVKYPKSVMAWGAFSGNKGRARLYFLTKNVTMRASNYVTVLEQHLLILWEIHECDFMHDDVPAHKAKTVSKFLNYHNINELECQKSAERGVEEVVGDHGRRRFLEPCSIYAQENPACHRLQG